MVARRLTGSTVSLLFRLMTLYQPGGEAERSRILSNLQNPPEESEPQKAVEALRAWDRWLRRCKELSLVTPDPTMLPKGLTKMVDTRPSYPSIDTYYKHLMAECEALPVEGSGDNATSTPAASTNELKEVLADVGKMLKAMTAVTTIKRAEVKDDPLWARIKALSTKLGCDLDSGASHPMRVAAEVEYDESIPVKVTLAGEEERVLRQKGLLGKWGSRTPFTKDLPADVQAMMVAGFNVNGGGEYLKNLPLARRKRRLLMASRDWVVRLFRGKDVEDDNFEKIVSRGGKVLLDVDVANSKMMDLNGASPIYQLLLWAAAKGKISDLAVHRKLHGLLP
eukprot:s4375_g6.t1